MLRSMRFECPKTKKISRPPSISNWIRLIEGVEYLWRKLEGDGFQYLSPRNLNQDALENFFSLVRSHGQRNVNPTSAAFTNSFKTLIINNFMSDRSISSNCEDDGSVAILHNFKNFLTEDIEDIQSDHSVQLHYNIMEHPQESAYVSAYICGYIAKKIFNKIHSCDTCIKNLTTTEEQSVHLMIMARRYSKKCLLLPSTKFMILFKEASSTISHLLIKYCLCNKVCDNIKKSLLQTINFESIYCEIHSDIRHQFLSELTTLMMFTWVKRINKIIRGVDSRFTPSLLSDPVFLLAHKKYLQRRK